MTAVLIVSNQGKQVDKVAVDKDRFVIGRSRKTDLRLDDKNISREHAVLLTGGNGPRLQDRGSRNGTRVNGEVVNGTAPLKSGDTIAIGPFELKYFESGGETTGNDDSESKTRLAGAPHPSGNKQRSKESRSTSSGRLQYSLRAVEGPLRGTSFDNWEGYLTIGRGLENNVILQEDAVSNAHARIWMQDGVFLLEDLKSSNGTFIQGTRAQSARLKHGDKIRIGHSTFILTAVDRQRRKFRLLLTAMSMLFVVILAAVISALIPVDQRGLLLEKGRQQIQRGDYPGAKSTFEQVLKGWPGDKDAEKLLGTAGQGIERDEILAGARKAAANEQYDEALAICDQLIAQYPKYSKAIDLKGEITNIKDAQLALDNRNWSDAIKYLKKARLSYPDSTLLQRMLDKAQGEHTATENLQKAKECIANSQPDRAREALMLIPSASCYSVEAQGIIEQMKSADAVSGMTTDAHAAYRSGDIAGTLSLVGDGLRAKPGDAGLLALKRKAEQIAPLAEQTGTPVDPTYSDDIEAMHDMATKCDELCRIEPDPENVFHKKAAAMASSVAARLAEVEKDAMTQGEVLMNSGDRIQAYMHFKIAVRANPKNEKAVKLAGSIKSEVSAQCGKYYKEGLVHEELGQTAQAAECYEQIVRLGLEDDSYTERAKAKLLQLKR